MTRPAKSLVKQWQTTVSTINFDLTQLLLRLWRMKEIWLQDARLWLWTARIPSTAKTLVVQNCRHVEIHPDCTKGLRYYSMLEFKAINISHLEFLSPIRSGIFLHDNDQIAQAPPSMTLINVETVNFYPKLFDEPKGGCRYKTFKLNQMSLNNVKIDKLAAFTFNHQEMSNISLTNVTIKTMEPEAMSIIADDIEIQDSTFGLPSNAMQFNATNVSVECNQIYLKMIIQENENPHFCNLLQ